MYEGIVFRCSDAAAPAAFRALPAPFPLRLVRLADDTFGVYRVAGRADRFDVDAMTSLAAALSESTAAALAVFYDNRCGLREGGRLPRRRASGRVRRGRRMVGPAE